MKKTQTRELTTDHRLRKTESIGALATHYFQLIRLSKSAKQ